MIAPSTQQQGVVKVERLTKSYGAVTILRNIDLTVAKGQVVAILGSSGSGKTTLLRCLNLLAEPDSGLIAIDGEVIFNAASKAIRDRLPGKDVSAIRSTIGMVFQQFNLFPHMNVLNNVMEGPRVVRREADASNRARAMELLNKVGLGEFADRMPEQLSGGQKQRVSIARALNMRPKLMLFDEPTSALDPELVGEVLSTIIDLAREGMTMLVVTHELGFALEIADRVLFLHEGTIVADGTPAEVLLRPTNERVKAFVNRFHATAELLRPLLH